MTENITTTWNPQAPLADWDDPENWTNGVPNKDKIAVVETNKATASSSNDVTVKELQLMGNGWVNLGGLIAEKILVADEGFFVASRAVTVSHEFRFTGGSVRAFTHVDILPTATLHIEGSDKKAFNGQLHVRGKGVLNFKGRLNLSNESLEIETTGALEVREAAKFDGWSTVSNSGRLQIAAPLHLLETVTLKNSDLGTLQITIPDQTEAQSPRVTVEDWCVLDGTLALLLGFAPAVGVSMQVLSYTHREGEFAAIESSPGLWHWQADYGATGLSVQRVP